MSNKDMKQKLAFTLPLAKPYHPTLSIPWLDALIASAYVYVRPLNNTCASLYLNSSLFNRLRNESFPS
jgi:hypothetical protein